MDRWKYFAITHADHVICNPLSVDKLDEIVALLDLPAGAQVLDIACGKAELLIRLVERYGVHGEGVDLSAPELAEARRRLRERAPAAVVTLTEQDGQTYEAPPATYDLAVCLGASWIFGGHRRTLQALQRWLRPGGLILVGEPFWRHEPDPEYLVARGFTAASFASHADNVAAGLDLGLVFLYSVVSSEDDWDRYEGLQWRAAERYRLAHPDDPDLPDLLERVRSRRDAYLRWERSTLGWAAYLFQSAGA